MTKRADEFLAEAAATFKERNAIYGDNWQQVGEVMAGLFPKGVEVSSINDWNRMHILLLVIVKLTRYANNWDEGGHADSIHDAMVYCGMLEAIDAGIVEKRKDNITKPLHFCKTCDKREICEKTMICQQKARIGV